MTTKENIITFIRSLGLHEDYVNRIEVSPGMVCVRTLLKNESGSKYVDKSGELATEWHTIRYDTVTGKDGEWT